MATVTLKAEETLYSAISIADTRLAYKAGSRLEGQFYHTGRWNGRGFTCSPEVFKLYKNQGIAQLTLSESTYKTLDPATGNEVERLSATLDGYVTFDGKIGLIENLTKLRVAEAKSELSVKYSKVAAIAELGISQEDMKLMEELV